jgi:hypothetical protein
VFFKGLGFGLLAVGVNFALMFIVVRSLTSRGSTAVRLLVPLVNVLRYVVFGGLIYLFLKFGLGTIWGLLTGVTLGIAGNIIWQVVNNGRHRRSSSL